MPHDQILPINFTLSPKAREAIEHLREYSKERNSKSGEIASFAWGHYYPNGGKKFEAISFGFYREDQREEIAPFIQYIDGMEMVFFVTEKDHGKFEGKVIDFAEGRGFFFQEPATGE
jgi:hypothetical protein